MSKRIYKVEDREFDRVRLVRANTPAQALRHATLQSFSVDVATQDDLVALVANGATVETAGESSASEPAARDPSDPRSANRRKARQQWRALSHALLGDQARRIGGTWTLAAHRLPLPRLCKPKSAAERAV